MTLEQMKEIASKRTKGEWGLATPFADEHGWGYRVKSLHDSKFIAMAANNWDKVMKVVEAAKAVYDNQSHYLPGKDWSMDLLVKSLAELEREVEPEPVKENPYVIDVKEIFNALSQAKDSTYKILEKMREGK